MEFSNNIIVSLVGHATLLTAALMLSGGGAALHVPEAYIAVALFERAADYNTPAMGTGKKEPAKKAAQVATGLREIAPPEVPLPAQSERRSLPMTPEGKNSPLQGAAEPEKTGMDKGNSAASSGQNEGHGVSRIYSAAVWPAISGKTAAPGGSGDGENNGAGENPATINAVRAAIERAKSYPPLARRWGIEGTVTTEFTISATGYPENIRIVKSSGYEILDAAAKKTLLRASPLPAIKGNLAVPITFKIER